MLYGIAKRRQMARSLLPSTARREAARDLARVRRRGRRRIGEHLRALSGSFAVVAEGWDDATFDGRAWPQREIKEVVWDRRAYDKVGPFERWAVAVTAHLQPPERLDAMREVVPPGLMGRHALSHIDFLDHFSGHLPTRYWTCPPASPARPGPDYGAELRRMLDEGRLGEFNRWMKRPEFAKAGAEPACRTLAGKHDIDAFLDDCFDVAKTFTGRYRPVQPRPWFDGLRSGVRSGSGPGSHAPRNGPRGRPPVPPGPGTDRDLG